MRNWSPKAIHAVVLIAAWIGLATLLWVPIFLTSSRTVDLIGHRTEVRPNLEGTVEIRFGPVLPDVRAASGSRIGAVVALGQTDADSTQEQFQRYAAIGSQPAGQIRRLRATLRDMAVSAAFRAAAFAALPVGAWLLLGSRRRRELFGLIRTPNGLLTIAVAGAVAISIWQPWQPNPEELKSDLRWTPLPEFLGPTVPLPPEVRAWEARGDVLSSSNRKLALNMLETYRKSDDFYELAADVVAELDVRQPKADETVAMLVTDRHDNVGMDQVGRAIFDRAKASVILDGGDDTSTGSEWEAFSLDSLEAEYSEFDRYAVTGNHDNGEFVADYLDQLGWQILDGTPVTTVDGFTLVGVNDPRSSGLGSWRDETGLSFAEVGERLADEVCASDTRVSTVLVHDANLALETLQRGCADLVVSGHVHVRSGPTEVVGENGKIGYTYTNGTSGGAAYAIALGKIRREAMVSLITYREGRPIGVQSVTLQTNGVFEVSDFAELDYGEEPEKAKRSKAKRRPG